MNSKTERLYRNISCYSTYVHPNSKVSKNADSARTFTDLDYNKSVIIHDQL